ncbi:MAG: glycerophosphodiester phosphodiesterase family protein [bacterium]
MKENEYKLIAHRLGYKMTQSKENSLDSLKEIFKNEEFLNICNGFELDINFTKDNIPVVMHDKKLKNKMKIKKLYYKELHDIDTLESILVFLLNNKVKLGDKKIKIETKSCLWRSRKNIKVFINLLNKYSSLNKNIIHLSSHPINLIISKNYNTCIETDILCYFKSIYYIYNFLFKNDYVSLRMSFKDKLDNENMISYMVNYITKGSVSNKIIYSSNKNYKNINIFLINNTTQLNEFHNKYGKYVKNKDIYITTSYPNNIKNRLNLIAF